MVLIYSYNIVSELEEYSNTDDLNMEITSNNLPLTDTTESTLTTENIIEEISPYVTNKVTNKTKIETINVTTYCSEAFLYFDFGVVIICKWLVDENILHYYITIEEVNKECENIRITYGQIFENNLETFNNQPYYVCDW